jgi:hypothetical protein
MILIDISQIAIANIMVSSSSLKNELNDNLIKHMIITSLLELKLKFGHEFGDMVICADGRQNWRKNIFPHYKAARHKEKDNNFIDWENLYKAIESFKLDLKINFPYKVIELHDAEADDIIAVLSKNAKEPTLIVSSDKDFKQLHQYKNVKQYCPRKKSMINVSNPSKELLELVIRGDVSDGVPNIRSDGDTFVDKAKRQLPMTVKHFENFMKEIPKELQENYERNDRLINFKNIPINIQQRILEEYNKPALGNKQKIYQYFMNNRMKNLLQNVGKF